MRAIESASRSAVFLWPWTEALDDVTQLPLRANVTAGQEILNLRLDSVGFADTPAIPNAIVPKTGGRVSSWHMSVELHFLLKPEPPSASLADIPPHHSESGTSYLTSGTDPWLSSRMLTGTL